ncbi:extradiol ring-cleavage dioxygenase [Dietzia sp. UCD-THP]|uniref:4,5-DOPA-extradiol-dioxygenase n=1 Tax=Dietzia sp. UCD-THP TaxID=1292020 RepID=UPI00037C9F34|nr:4,5-DOPA dioxygenase extradiol [Dietzia sp. UCD-THP]EYT62362.1 extradiol ring-cleavage dioxygenase [Dietzia sp. UCD-THP]
MTTTPSRQPAVFIGHGVPLNALEDNQWTRQWAAFGAGLTERPRAVLAVSAHWYIGATAVTTMARPRTIHDFYGFPRELNEYDYPAAGAPELASEVAEVVRPTWIGEDRDSWGLDHGTWSVLAHVFPDADVPVAQLSVDASKPADYHFDLGTRLSALRDSGVLILASGNVVHNLAAVDPSLGDSGTDWAHRFDDHARALLTDRPEDAVSLLDHPDARLAVPSADHFLPLLYTAGMAAGSGERLDAFSEGYAWGSVSMTSYRSAA